MNCYTIIKIELSTASLCHLDSLTNFKLREKKRQLKNIKPQRSSSRRITIKKRRREEAHSIFVPNNLFLFFFRGSASWSKRRPRQGPQGPPRITRTRSSRTRATLPFRPGITTLPLTATPRPSSRTATCPTTTPTGPWPTSTRRGTTWPSRMPSRPWRGTRTWSRDTSTWVSENAAIISPAHRNHSLCLTQNPGLRVSHHKSLPKNIGSFLRIPEPGQGTLLPG